MINLDPAIRSLTAEAHAFPDGHDEAEEVVVFELLVPRASKVPPIRQHLEVAPLIVRPSSVSSTVSAGILADLQVSDTARRISWNATATLKAPAQSPRR
jgi:hypothetical protein